MGFRASAIALLLWLAVLPLVVPLGFAASLVAAVVAVVVGVAWDQRRRRRESASALETPLPSWPRRIEFTRDGKYFVGITVGVGLAAINTGNNLLYLVLGLLLSLIIASGVLSEMSLRDLRVERRPPSRIYAGRPFLMGIALTNAKRKLPSFSIEVEDLLGQLAIDKRCYFLKVPSGRTQHTSYRYTFARRGRYRYAGFRVATKFPFALFRKSRVVPSPGEVIVFPSIHPVPGLPAPPAPGGSLGAAGRIGRHGEFYGLRPMRPGDDSRDIHWRASARRGELLVREREEPAARRILLVLDNAASAIGGPPGGAKTPQATNTAPDLAGDNPYFERLVNLTASLAVHYLDQGYLVGLVNRGVAIAPAAGPVHRIRLLTRLALIEPADDALPLPLGPHSPAERLLVNSFASQLSTPGSALAAHLAPPQSTPSGGTPTGPASLAERTFAAPVTSPSLRVYPGLLIPGRVPKQPLEPQLGPPADPERKDG